MGLFSRITRRRGDPLQKQAENLVTSAQILATSAYTSVADDFPLVLSIDTQRWDAVLTVAGVFIAATRANHAGLSESRVDSLMEVVAQRLSAWRSDGIAGFEDCKSFFDRTYDGLKDEPDYRDQPRFLGADAIGSWIIWNLLEHPPESEDERRLVRVLGTLVTHSFFDWWSQ